MYVWSGKLAPTDLRKSAASLAKDLWDQGYNYTECDINPFNASFGKSAFLYQNLFSAEISSDYAVAQFKVSDLYVESVSVLSVETQVPSKNKIFHFFNVLDSFLRLLQWFES